MDMFTYMLSKYASEEEKKGNFFERILYVTEQAKRGNFQ
jgi:hypothetical protein